LFHRASVIVLELIAGLLLLIAICGGVLAWQFSKGPIRVDLLNDVIGKALTDESLGVSTTVGATEIAWSGWNRAFDLIARDVVVRERGQEVAASIDKIVVALSGEALLAGTFLPKRIEVLEPSITVRHKATGGWSLIPEDTSSEAGREFDIAALLGPLAGGVPGSEDPINGNGAGGSLASLVSITVRDADVTVVDEIRDQTLRFGRVELELNRSVGGLAFRGRAQALWQQGAVSDLSLAGRYEPATQGLTVQLDAGGLPPAALARLDPALAPLDRLSATLSSKASLKMRLGTDGIEGRIDISATEGSLSLPEHLSQPVPLGGGALTIDITDGGDVIAADGSFDLGGPSVAIRAQVGRGGTGWGILVDGGVSDLPLNDLRTYWPPAFNPGTHEWITENLRDGIVDGVTIRLQGWMDGTDVDSLQIDELTGKIDFSNVTTHYYRPLPPVQHSDGSATFNQTSFDIQIHSGQLRGLTVNEGSNVFISNIGTDRLEVASVDLSVQGPLADALWVLDQEPLGYAAEIGLNPDTVKGLAGARVKFEIPLLKDLKVEEVKIGAAANLSGVEIQDAIEDADLTEGELALDLTGTGMKVSGTALILGERAEVRVEESFVEGSGIKTREWIKTKIDARGLAELGFDLTGRMTGTTEATVDRETTWNGETLLSLEADLGKTGLLIPELNWEKPEDTAGVVRAKLVLSNGVPQLIRSIEVIAGELAVNASADFDQTGAFLTADISQLRFGKTRAAGRIERVQNTGWRATLSGPVIDLTPIIGAESDDVTPSEPDAISPLHIEARLFADKLILSDDRPAVMNAALGIRQTGERLEQLSLKGQIAGGEASMTVDPVRGERLLSLRAADAGAFLQAFDTADNIRGGTLKIDGKLTGDGIEDGMDVIVQMDEFRVIDAPGFAKVLSSASFTGLNDTLNGDGIRFARARGRAIVTKDTLDIRDVVAYGPGLGLKLNGVMERETEIAHFVGLLAPAYSLSRLIDQIPVLGELLTGGEGEGLLATEFRLDGPLEDPSITINPLTALAPGFLRDLVSTSESPGYLPADIPGPGLQQPEDLGR
jgi:hypothetical protein